MVSNLSNLKMERANKTPEESPSSPDNSPTNRETGEQPPSSGSATDNLVIYPLYPHVGYLVLPSSLLTPDPTTASIERTNEGATESINPAVINSVSPHSAPSLVWDSTLLSCLGENLRPATFGTALPSGRVIYNISEPRAELSLPPARFFESSPNELQTSQRPSETESTINVLSQGEQPNGSEEPDVGALQPSVFGRPFRNYSIYTLIRHQGVLRLPRFSGMPFGTRPQLSEQSFDSIMCRIPDGYIRYNLLHGRGRLYLPPPNNLTLSPELLVSVPNRVPTTNVSNSTPGPSSSDSGHSGSVPSPRSREPQLPNREPRPPSRELPLPRPIIQAPNSDDEENYEDDEQVEDNPSAEARRMQFVNHRQLAYRRRRRRVRQLQGHVRRRRTIYAPFIRYPIKRRKYLKRR